MDTQIKAEVPFRSTLMIKLYKTLPERLSIVKLGHCKGQKFQMEMFFSNIVSNLQFFIFPTKC